MKFKFYFPDGDPIPSAGGGSGDAGKSNPPPASGGNGNGEGDKGGNGASGDAGGQDAFLKLLPEEYRKDPAFAPFKDLNGLVKSYKEQQRLIGLEKIPVPKDTDPPEAWDSFYHRLGRPAKPDEYKLRPPDEKALFQPEEGFIKSIKEAAHKSGMSQKQLNALYDSYTALEEARLNEILKDAEAEHVKAVAELDKEWGLQKERNFALAQAAIQHFGGEAFKEFMNETRLGDHPKMVRVWAKIGQKMAEDDPTFTFGTNKRDFAPTPKEAQDQIKAMQRDAETMTALQRRDHPKHKEAQEKYDSLYEAAYPKPQGGGAR